MPGPVTTQVSQAFTNTIGRSADTVTSLTRQLSAGRRIERTSDGAAEAAVGARLNLELNAFSAAKTNISDGKSLLGVADGAFKQAEQMLTRMRVLAVAASSQNISDTERALLNAEYQSLMAETGRIALDTKYNGKKMLGINNDPDVPFKNFDLVFRVLPATVIHPANPDGNGNGFADAGEGVELDFFLQNDSDSVIENIVVSGATISTGWTFFSNTGANISTSLAPGASVTTSTTSDLDLNIPGGTNGVSFTVSMTVNFEINGDSKSFYATFGPATVGAISEGTRMPIQTLIDLSPEENPDRVNHIRVGTGILATEDQVNMFIPQSTLGKLSSTLPLTTIDTVANAESALTQIDNAVNTLISGRAEIGALINRLEAAGRSVDTTTLNIDAARARLLDLDIPGGISELLMAINRLRVGVSAIERYTAFARDNSQRLFSQIET